MQAHTIVPETLRRITRAEYDRMAEMGFFTDERVELIRGMIVRMAPIGPPHSERVDLLTEIFVPPLLGRARVRIQQPFLACDESEPEPDVAVVPLGQYGNRHPDRAFLIVEVADSSLEYDRTTKAGLYAASGIEEYWIVNVRELVIEVHAKPIAGRYAHIERIEKSESLSPRAFPDVVLSLSRLFP